MIYRAVESAEADYLWERFTDRFIDKTSKYYKTTLRLSSHSDGWRYSGYLWEALLESHIISRDEAMKIFRGRGKVFVMWDLRTEEKTALLFRHRFPADMIMETTGEELVGQLEDDFAGEFGVQFSRVKYMFLMNRWKGTPLL